MIDLSCLSTKSVEVAAQLWCDPRVEDRVMDPVLAAVIAEKIDEYIYALAWCGATPIFQPEGEGGEGYRKVVGPLIQCAPTPDPKMVEASRAAYARRGDFKITEELLMEGDL